MSIIVMEGVDYSGKTTIGTALVAHYGSSLGLQHPFHHTAIGQGVYPLMGIAKTEETHRDLAAAAHAELWRTVILPAHGCGEIVFVDRGMLSYMVYERGTVQDFIRITDTDNERFDILHILLSAPIDVTRGRAASRIGQRDATDNMHMLNIVSLLSRFDAAKEQARGAGMAVTEVYTQSGILDTVAMCKGRIDTWLNRRVMR